MTFVTRFEIGQQVWFINNPDRVIESAKIVGIEIFQYNINTYYNRIRYRLDNSAGRLYHEEDLSASKQELINSL